MADEKTSKIPDANLFRCWVPIDVRFRDLDAMGHVNNAVYLTYFEMARVAYQQAITPGRKVRFSFILASATVNYLAPVSMGERLTAHLRVSHIGAKSFDYEYLIINEKTGLAVASGSTVQVSYDYTKQKTAEISPEFRQTVEAFEGHAI